MDRMVHVQLPFRRVNIRSLYMIVRAKWSYGDGATVIYTDM